MLIMEHISLEVNGQGLGLLSHFDWPVFSFGLFISVVLLVFYFTCYFGGLLIGSLVLAGSRSLLHLSDISPWLGFNRSVLENQIYPLYFA